MPSIYVNTRTRLQVDFQKDDLPFDPQLIFYEATFTPSTVGVPETKYAYQYGVDPQVVRSGVGIYYVEVLLDVVGSMKFTFRSTAWGEELTLEEICKVAARTVVQ